MSCAVLEDFIAAGVVCVTDIKGQSPSAKDCQKVKTEKKKPVLSPKEQSKQAIQNELVG